MRSLYDFTAPALRALLCIIACSNLAFAEPVSAPPKTTLLQQLSADIADIATQTVDSVVSLRAVASDGRTIGSGSGIVFHAGTYIMTNYHLVGNGNSIFMRHNNHDVLAKIIGVDPKSDLAVIQVPIADLPIAPIGDSDSLRIGELVLSIGNPWGLTRSLSLGIVSAKGRVNIGVADYEELIQTDAAFNPGSSGGALIDTQGRIVGINTAIVSRTGGNTGISFAIPINMALRIAKELITSGSVERGWLGMGVRNREDVGVVIARIVPGGPAAKAGLLTGDVIHRFNKRVVKDSYVLRNLSGNFRAGQQVPIDIIRGQTIIHYYLQVGQSNQ